MILIYRMDEIHRKYMNHVGISTVYVSSSCHLSIALPRIHGSWASNLAKADMGQYDAIIHYHPLSSIIIHYHPLLSIINYHPLSSIIIHYHDEMVYHMIYHTTSCYQYPSMSKMFKEQIAMLTCDISLYHT